MKSITVLWLGTHMMEPSVNDTDLQLYTGGQWFVGIGPRQYKAEPQRGTVREMEEQTGICFGDDDDYAGMDPNTKVKWMNDSAGSPWIVMLDD